GEVDLVAPGGQDRPLVIPPEQAVRRPPHMHEVLRMRPDAAQDAEDRLHEERRLQKLAVGEGGQRGRRADVVTFTFEARAPRICMRSSGCGTMPPRMPKIVCTKSGGSKSLRSRKCASV